MSKNLIDYSVMELKCSKFLGLSDFSFDFFTKKNTDAQAILSMYSCVEIAFKKAIKIVFTDSVVSDLKHTPMQEAIVRVVLDHLGKDSKGEESRFARIIKNQMMSERAQQTFILNEDFDSPSVKEIFRKVNKIKLIRHKIAHCACYNINKDLSQITEQGITMIDIFSTVREFVNLTIQFVDHHESYVDDIVNELEAQQYEYEPFEHDPWD